MLSTTVTGTPETAGTLPPRIGVRDVTLRDGLQGERVVPTAEKLAIFESLVAAGVADLELTSFVRADRIPALADAEELAAATAGSPPGVRRWGLVLNRRGAERALAAGITHLQFVMSVSTEHNLRNANRTPAQSVDELGGIAALAAGAVEVEVEVTLATAFGCPHTGAVAPEVVAATATAAVDAGATALSLADTIGTAVPTEVADLVAALRRAHPGVAIGLHLHDTRGLGMANALAGLAAGAARLDGTLGGLGGCPYAPGASGNLAIEDLVHALEAMGVRTGVHLPALVEAVGPACAAAGRPVDSHVGRAGPRFAVLHP